MSLISLKLNLVGESKKILARLKKKNSKVVVSISISHEKIMR